MRLRCIFKTSWTRDWYVHECESMGIRSTLRSTMTRTGRDEGVPEDEDGRWPWLEKRLSLEFRMWSLNLRSSFAAIISAGPPFGLRIIGIEPVARLAESGIFYGGRLTHGNYHTKKAADCSIYQRIYLLVCCLCAVQCPVCVFAHA